MRLRNRLIDLMFWFAALFAFWQCVPGFRPKHVRDIFFGFFTLKGMGIGLYFLTILLLVPVAQELVDRGWVRLRTYALFVILSLLMTVDMASNLAQNWLLPMWQGRVDVWIVRSVYVMLLLWALRCQVVSRRKRLLGWDEFINGFFFVWKGLFNTSERVLLFLVSFFLVRQEMHLYLFRLNVYGDEVSWWYTGAKEIMNHGLTWTMQHHNYGYYTPAIPWLISFPVRLIGSHIEEWLWGFPLFAMTVMGILLIELSSEIVKKAKGFLIGWSVLFLLFLLSRDLMHMFGAFFYGEAIASALLGILVAEIFVRGNLTSLNPMQAVCFGLFASFCIMAKPPLSILMNAYIILLAGIQFYGQFSRKYKQSAQGLKAVLRTVIPQVMMVLSTSLFLKFFWQKTLLLKTDHVPEYSVKLSEVFKNGIHLEIPWGMCLALFNWGTFQAAYAYGMVVAVLIVILKGHWRLLFYQISLIVVYWGFVFGLYATYWYNGDYGSAGRYLSHAAVAVVLLLPLIYHRKPQKL